MQFLKLTVLCLQDANFKRELIAKKRESDLDDSKSTDKVGCKKYINVC